jgi:hypothetical protein
MPEPIDHTDILIGSPVEQDGAGIADIALHLEPDGRSRSGVVLSEHGSKDSNRAWTNRQILASAFLDVRLRLEVLTEHGASIVVRPDAVGEPKLVDFNGSPLGVWSTKESKGVGKITAKLWAEDGNGSVMSLDASVSGSVVRLSLWGGTGLVRGTLAFAKGGAVKQEVPTPLAATS